MDIINQILLMNAADFNRQEESFNNRMNELEKEYYLYFGLKSIQKGLDRTESVYDHFRLEHKFHQLEFFHDSDLPEEIRKLIIEIHHQIFCVLTSTE